VAMFDYLGFKAQLEKKGTTGLYQLYNNGLYPIILESAALKTKTVQVEGKGYLVPVFGPHSVEYRIFSDTVLFLAIGHSFEDFFRIVSASHSFLCSGFGMTMPLRGAIGYGDIVWDNKSILVGRAIVDAYLGEAAQVWSGCALTPVCQEFAEEKGYIDLYQKVLERAAEQEKDEAAKDNYRSAKRRIVRYEIPVKGNPKETPVVSPTRTGYALDWTLNCDCACESAFGETSDPHAQTIIKNTMEFEKWARSKNR
ncbi:MAG: hypothetical protein HQK59_13685, partial [Deltaproteobacteria bacterium]|nr:hypothetical protein [Deltaproteobacteria bacterium]